MISIIDKNYTIQYIDKQDDSEDYRILLSDSILLGVDWLKKNVIEKGKGYFLQHKLRKISEEEKQWKVLEIDRMEGINKYVVNSYKDWKDKLSMTTKLCYIDQNKKYHQQMNKISISRYRSIEGYDDEYHRRLRKMLEIFG